MTATIYDKPNKGQTHHRYPTKFFLP